jgi:hypothetical protein
MSSPPELEAQINKAVLAKASEVLEKELLPAVDAYHYPDRTFTRSHARQQISRIRRALAQYENAKYRYEKSEAMLEIMRATGTRSQPQSLYGAGGGTKEKTNPGNPKGQELSRTADKLRRLAVNERNRLGK